MLCTECEYDPLCHYDVQQNRCSNADDSYVTCANDVVNVGMFVSLSLCRNPKMAIARLQPEAWCKKSVQRPGTNNDGHVRVRCDNIERSSVIVGKLLQLTRKKGETVWLQCDVTEHLRSSIEWRWNGRNIQETLFNNFLLTKDQSKCRSFACESIPYVSIDSIQI
jgi:hypothetical protein